MKVATKRRVTGRRVRGPAKAREGVGSIETLPSGRFRVRVWVEGQKKGDTFATREEAERQRATLAVRHREVAETAPREPEAPTLASWGETWLKRRDELGAVRNARGDRTRWGMYVAGTELAARPLEDLRPKHVHEWVDAMVKRRKVEGGGRLSPQTIRHAFNLLRLALSDAMRAEHITANPCDGAKLPRVLPPAFAYLSGEEIARVEGGATDVPAEAQRAFVVAIYTGMREGEIIALRVGDLTLAGARLEVHVQRSHDGPPKNGKTRRVPLFPQALAALRAQLAHLGETAPDDLVFPSARGHQRQPSDDFGWSSRRRRPGAPTGFKAALGITRPVRFHELRHTTASHLAMGTWTGAPWPIQDIAAFMGHGSLAMTQRYMHLSPGYLHDRVRGPSTGDTEGGGAGSSERGTKAPRGTEAVVPRSTGNTACPARLERATGGLEGRCSIRLSYGHGRRGSGWRDSNPRHLAPKASALPGCATPRPPARKVKRTLTRSPEARHRLRDFLQIDW